MPSVAAPWENLRKAVKTVIIGEGVERISPQAFKDCINVDSVSVSATAVSIGEEAFAGCAALPSLVLPEKLRTIESKAFAGCAKLASINIPANVTYMGTCVFENAGLTSIVIPSKITLIPQWAFHNCESLTSVTMSKAVTAIHNDAFAGCNSLEEIVIPEAVTSIGGMAFKDCSSLKSIEIPRRVTEIGNDIFSGCFELKSVILPEGLPYIPDFAFSNCSNIDSINIPASVKSIGVNAFGNCRLSDVYVNWTLPVDIGDKSAFYGMTMFVATLHVPPGTKGLYEATEVWKEFGTITEQGAANGVTLDQAAIEVELGADPVNLVATVSPPDAINKNLVWTSSNEAVATVDSAGSVTFVGVGSALITVTTVDGQHAAVCSVTVKEAGVPDGVETLGRAPVSVGSYGGGLQISGLRAGAEIKIYTISGRLIYSGKALGDGQYIPLSSRGALIVVAAGSTMKVICK